MNEMESAIRSELETFWNDRAIPSGPEGETTVDELVAPVESMTAVDVLAGLDAITGLNLPNKLIRKGGYTTCAQFVEDLTTKVMEQLALAAASGTGELPASAACQEAAAP